MKGCDQELKNGAGSAQGYSLKAKLSWKLLHVAVNEVGEVGMVGVSSDSRGANEGLCAGTQHLTATVRPPTGMEKTVAIKETE